MLREILNIGCKGSDHHRSFPFVMVDFLSFAPGTCEAVAKPKE